MLLTGKMKCWGHGFVLVILILSANLLKGQPVFYTQWNNTPLLINPAFNGYYNSNMRFSGIYRSINEQGLEGQRFYQFNFEAKPFQELLTNDLDEWSIGVTTNSFTAIQQTFTHNTLALTTCYSKALNEDGTHALAFGFQAAMQSQKVDLSNLSFSTQFDVTGFNRLLPNFEHTQSYNNNYVDLNAGILYSFGTENESFFIGLGGHQLNRTRRDISADPKFNPVIDLSLGFSRYINDKYLFHVSGDFSFNSPTNERMLMAGFGTSVSELTEGLFMGGLYYRFDSQLSPFVQFQTKGLKMTLSYDTYASPKLTGVADRRALELSASFRLSSKDRGREARLDCFK